jgi:hypothetical protein
MVHAEYMKLHWKNYTVELISLQTHYIKIKVKVASASEYEAMKA